MPKQVWMSGAACGLLLMAATIAHHVRQAEEAKELSDRAEKLLHPALSDASSPLEVRASEARSLCEEAQELVPSRQRATCLAEARAIERLQHGDYAKAEALLRPIAQSDDANVLLLSAELALAQKNAPRAERALARIRPEARATARVSLVRSDVARALGRGDEALTAADSGIERDPHSAALFERRGLAYELLGDDARAARDLEQAATLDRHGSAALLALGRVRRAEGQLSAAVLAFHDASQRDPNDAEAWLGSGVCRAALGDLISAQVDLEQAATLAPTRIEPLLALGDVDVAQQQLASGVRRYRAAVLLGPNDAIARVKLGNALLRLGQVDDADAAFRAALERQPELSAAHNGLGASLLARGDLGAAERELKSAAALDGQDAHPFLNLARLYKRRGDAASLADALAHAEARDPALSIVSQGVASARRPH